jgi:hypothetical protein
MSSKGLQNHYSEGVTTVATSGGAHGLQMAVSPVLTPFTPEFRLMLSCLRWPLGAEELNRIALQSETIGDWHHLLKITRRHRVVGLVWRALGRSGCAVPPDTAAAFQRSASSAAKQAMRLSVESIKLGQLLESRGIDALFLKGITVTLLAYGDPTVRHAKDIDLLVPPASIERTVALLREAGYEPSFDLESVPQQRRALWVRYTKSMDWVNPRNNVLLELHWRLTDAPLLHATPGELARQSVAIAPGRFVDTLADRDLLAYLCVHGAAHGWMRLKWLADVYALLPHEAQACEAVYRGLQQLGAGRSAGQALLLCHDLLDLPLTAGLLRELESKFVLRKLRASAMRLLVRGGEVKEVDDLAFGTTSVYMSRVMLGSNLRSLLAEWRTWAYQPDELLRSRLPQSLFFLFPLLRMRGWLMTRVRHRGRSIHSERP